MIAKVEYGESMVLSTRRHRRSVVFDREQERERERERKGQRERLACMGALHLYAMGDVPDIDRCYCHVITTLANDYEYKLILW